MPAARRENLGPRAAEANRDALVRAAREVFADVGIRAPLSAVAKRAGVGQGSLYRHFPDRISLAVAVFEDNVAELESLAAEPTTTLDDLLALLTTQAIDSAAFVDMVSPATDDPRLQQIEGRVACALTGKLTQAQHEGEIRPTLAAEDLFLAIEMIASLLAKTPIHARATTAEAAWRLLRVALAPDHAIPAGEVPATSDGWTP